MTPVVMTAAVETTSSAVLLWTLQRDAHSASCIARTAGSTAALEMSCNGSLIAEYAFLSLGEAVAWAEIDRQSLLEAGWRGAVDD